MEEQDLITYCGGYGGACARWCGYTWFRDLVGLLAEWVDAQGYQHWMPDETHEFDYREFRKGLAFFAADDSWLVCHRCCKGGDGYAECAIRRCCVERRLATCFDCEEFPCARVENDAGMIERARAYKARGRQAWLRQQVEKANQGYEGHTGNYYRFWASKHPPNLAESA
jgi:hypothetical protein